MRCFSASTSCSSLRLLSRISAVVRRRFTASPLAAYLDRSLGQHRDHGVAVDRNLQLEELPDRREAHDRVGRRNELTVVGNREAEREQRINLC